MRTKKLLLISIALCVTLALFGNATIAQEKAEASVTLEGQVVCSSCWFEADRKVTPYGNDGDLKCAVDCARKGKAQALAVAGANGITLYLLETGKLAPQRGDWLDYIAKQVKATGITREADGKRYLKVDSIEVVESEAKQPFAQHQKPAGQDDSEIQAFTVKVTDGGYEPASLELKRGVTARITFVRESKTTCGTAVLIPDYDKKQELPLNEPVVIQLTPRKSGEFAFTCGIGMLRGKILVQ